MVLKAEENLDNNSISYGHQVCILAGAESYYKEAISLPLYPALSEDDQHHVIQVLSEVLPREHRITRKGYDVIR